MEQLFKKIFFCTALVSVIAVALICIFMFASGVPAMAKIGFSNFLFGKTWKPETETFGIYAMILASFAVTFGAIVLAVMILPTIISVSESAILAVPPSYFEGSLAP